MNTKPVLSAEDVKKILAAAEAHAQQNKWAVTIAVSDDGGHLLGMLRLDGRRRSPRTSRRPRPRPPRWPPRVARVRKIINNGRYSFLSAPLLEGMLEGGVPVVADGHVVGAVGVSGVKSSEDAQIAQAGIAALGL